MLTLFRSIDHPRPAVLAPGVLDAAPTIASECTTWNHLTGQAVRLNATGVLARGAWYE